MLAVKAYSTSNELNSVTEKKEFSGLFEMFACLWQTKHGPRIGDKKKSDLIRKGENSESGFKVGLFLVNTWRCLPMGTITAKQLKQKTGEVIKRIKSGERLTLTYRGKLLAVIEPTTNKIRKKRYLNRKG